MAKARLTGRESALMRRFPGFSPVPVQSWEQDDPEGKRANRGKVKAARDRNRTRKLVPVAERTDVVAITARVGEDGGPVQSDVLGVVSDGCRAVRLAHDDRPVATVKVTAKVTTYADGKARPSRGGLGCKPGTKATPRSGIVGKVGPHNLVGPCADMHIVGGR